MRKGIVSWFDKTKGYGFIEDIDESEKTYFFHYTAINSKKKFKYFDEGDHVAFDIGTAPNGKECALNVTSRE